MSIPTIWHNPRCSKSRATLKLLEAHGHEPEIRLYLDNPPMPRELEEVAAALGVEPAAMIRPNETAYAQAGLTSTTPSAVLIAAMAAAPILIERPIVLYRDRAVIGRPPEQVLSLFG